MTKTEQKRDAASADRIKAMGHPLRRAVLKHVIEKGESSPVEIFWALGGKLHLVAYHVRALEKFGFLEKVREEKVRGAVKNFYVATDRHLIDTEEWESIDPGDREGLLVDFMQPIVDDFTGAVKSGILGRDGDWIVTRTPIHATDRQGFEEMREAHRELFERVLAIQHESLERMAASGEEPIAVSSGQTCFAVESF